MNFAKTTGDAVTVRNIPDGCKCSFHPYLDRLDVTGQSSANTTIGDKLMIWNSDLSANVEMDHASRETTGEHTFDHLYVVRNEANIILNFEARVSRIFEDKVSGACIKIHLSNPHVCRRSITNPSQ